MDLDELLEYWEVNDPNAWENDEGPKGWWAVSNGDKGIVAYFLYEADAFRYRLDQINRTLNP